MTGAVDHPLLALVGAVVVVVLVAGAVLGWLLKRRNGWSAEAHLTVKRDAEHDHDP